MLVAEAAHLAGVHTMTELADELARALDRLLGQPAKADPGCGAKVALAQALVQLGGGSADLYGRGIRHRQPEPAFGGPVDTAAALRAACALGLASTAGPEAMWELARLLADKELEARVGAIRAIGACGPPAVPALAYKVHRGDDDGRALYECMAALARLAPEPARALLAELLADERDVVAESAAMALGSSRDPAALAPLVAAWEVDLDAGRRRVYLLAIATLRVPAAIDFLLEQLAALETEGARDVLEALALLRADRALRRRVREVAAARGDLGDPWREEGDQAED